MTHRLSCSALVTASSTCRGRDIKIGCCDTLAALERLRPTLGDDTALLADMAQVHVRLEEAHMPGCLASRNDLPTATRHAEPRASWLTSACPAQGDGEGQLRLAGLQPAGPPSSRRPAVSRTAA